MNIDKEYYDFCKEFVDFVGDTIFIFIPTQKDFLTEILRNSEYKTGKINIESIPKQEIKDNLEISDKLYQEFFNDFIKRKLIIKKRDLYFLIDFLNIGLTPEELYLKQRTKEGFQKSKLVGKGLYTHTFKIES